MTQKFQYSGKVQVLHLNTRKEGPDDEKSLAVDVKVKAITSADVLTHFDENMIDFLFTDMGAVRNQMIGEIPMRHSLEDYRMDFSHSNHFGVKVKKFLLDPMDGYQVGVTFQITFQPSSIEIAQIAEFLHEEIFVSLQPANDELGFGAVTSSLQSIKNLDSTLRGSGTSMEVHIEGEPLVTLGEAR